MLKVSKIKKKYKNFELDCSLEVLNGHITALVGKNGAGKSTTFKAILDLINLDSGSISLFSKDVKELNQADKESLGFVLSDSFFSAYLNINDIKLILKKAYSNFNEELFDQLVNELGLPYDKSFKDFSTGMKAKIKVIVAISHNAKFLLLDEPTSGLDVVAREEIIGLIRDYIIDREDRSILISSHISSDIETLCDDIYIIDNGKIIAHEYIDDILNDYAIVKLSFDDYEIIDKDYVIACYKETYGYKLLVKERQYYLDNFKNLVIEKANLDELIKILTKGEM